MDGIQKRIEFLKATIKLLKTLVEFIAGYFPQDTDFGESPMGINSSWEFYNQTLKK